ncbi:dihydrolipoyllysine-residue succinyltransferase component of 2-oxoglutarate dehydrogenase complex-like [Scomber japonicus]|uniref:dihydrolipoyllysine-residue succinyltransferase component of 2-oxoglutarate dehydrogenase complex-like n=1 Tax=Scomber japonicus TaxID=13676 RepID=UPI00230602A2|nr:dihydrolipoyllysine-residue succinyltransferase component of 2-oxoglutarate dehydrogenase complex-like [Scomber japonicus]
MGVSQLLLKTLEALGDDDFKTFKWYLTEGSDSWDAIPVYRLEKAPRTETASLMTQAYGDDSAVNITAEILGKMNKKVVAEKLKKTYAEGRAPTAAPAAPPAAAAAAPAAVSAVGGSVVFAPTVTGSSTGTWNVTINK